ncbi:MAG: aldehyde dehydrogenase (NADP(+)) [Marmoricola sp.]
MQSVDPRTGEAFGPDFADTSLAELDRIVTAAQGAAAAFAAMPSSARARSLRAMADALDANTDRLAQIADRETGLGLPRLTGEVGRSSFQLRAFADFIEAGRHLGIVIDPEVPGAPPVGHPDLRRVNVALGPVAVYGASNFPFAFSVPGGDTASALAAGCPVVAKAHPGHLSTSVEVAAILESALSASGAPDGVFALVHGFEAGRELIRHPAIKAGAFTGSPVGGRALADLAAARPDPIPFYGELGSVNPVVVTPGWSGDSSVFAAQYVDSLTLGTGQFCTNPGLLLVPEGSQIVAKVVAEASSRAGSVMLHGGVLKIFGEEFAALRTIAGVEVLLDAQFGDVGFTTTPALLGATGATALANPALVRSECFGPAGVIIEYASSEELMALVDALGGALASTVHGEVDEPLAGVLIERLAAISGRVLWGGWPTGVAVSPAQHHGGPHPVSTNSLHTSVGAAAIFRFLRPVAYQSMPSALLPQELRG